MRAPAAAGRLGWLLCVLTAGAVAAAPDRPFDPRGPAPDPGLPSLAELEARGAEVGRVTVVVEEIFDRGDPRENHGLYRLADRLHIHTRESTVRAQILFRDGDRLRASQLQETERILRGNRYLYDAWVRPVAYDGHRADIEVRVRDVWTLNPGVNFGRTGGKNSSGFEIQDENFLGRGKDLEITHRTNVDRTSDEFTYEDFNLLGSWWRFLGQYADQSDGRTSSVQLARPFYSLDARWSFNASAFSTDRTDSRYDRGAIVDQFRRHEQSAELSGGWSPPPPGRWTQRFSLGARYDSNRFAAVPGAMPAAAPAAGLPPDRTLSYPFLAYDLIQDAFDKTRNQDQIARTEDLYYGLSVHAEAGFTSGSFGADRSATLFATNLVEGHRLSDEQSLFVTAAASGRLESGDARNLVGTAAARYYWRWDPLRVFYASLSGTATHLLDPDQQLLLGGDSGLRGYPLRYQGGTSLALLTLEQRFYTNWFPFRLFNVGAALFYDEGRVWGRGPVNTEPLGLLRDIGFGLRFGAARSGLGNVVHVDFSYALDDGPGVKKLQVTVQTLESF